MVGSGRMTLFSRVGPFSGVERTGVSDIAIFYRSVESVGWGQSGCLGPLFGAVGLVGAVRPRWSVKLAGRVKFY